MVELIDPVDRAQWQVPAFETPLWLGARHSHCVIIPVINEGQRIANLLKRMSSLGIEQIADVIIVDGGSTDGSLELDFLQAEKVRGLVLKKGRGKLSAQLRCAYAFALDQGYEGIVTIDGNDKDDPEAIPRFIQALDEGIDFVQASRYLPGGIGENTRDRESSPFDLFMRRFSAWPRVFDGRIQPRVSRLQPENAARQTRCSLPGRFRNIRASGLSFVSGTKTGFSLSRNCNYPSVSLG